MKEFKNKVVNFFEDYDTSCLFKFPQFWLIKAHIILPLIIIVSVVSFLFGVFYPNTLTNPLIDPYLGIVIHEAFYFKIVAVLSLPLVIYWSFYFYKLRDDFFSQWQLIKIFSTVFFIFLFYYFFVGSSFIVGKIYTTSKFINEQDIKYIKKNNNFQYGIIPEYYDKDFIFESDEPIFINNPNINENIKESFRAFTQLKIIEDSVLYNSNYLGNYLLRFIRLGATNNTRTPGNYYFSDLSPRSYTKKLLKSKSIKKWKEKIDRLDKVTIYKKPDGLETSGYSSKKITPFALDLFYYWKNYDLDDFRHNLAKLTDEINFKVERREMVEGCGLGSRNYSYYQWYRWLLLRNKNDLKKFYDNRMDIDLFDPKRFMYVRKKRDFRGQIPQPSKKYLDDYVLDGSLQEVKNVTKAVKSALLKPIEKLSVITRYDEIYRNSQYRQLKQLLKKYNIQYSYISYNVDSLLETRINETRLTVDTVLTNIRSISPDLVPDISDLNSDLESLSKKYDGIKFSLPLWYFKLEEKVRLVEHANRYLKEFVFKDHFIWLCHFLVALTIVFCSLLFLKFNFLIVNTYLLFFIALLIGRFLKIQDYFFINYVFIIVQLLSFSCLIMNSFTKTNTQFSDFCFNTVIFILTLFIGLGILTDYNLFFTYRIHYVTPTWVLIAMQIIAGISLFLISHIKMSPRKRS